ncbi:TetR family transcriptional regulator [Gordonia sp. (in: high G+C Gram-positive bacteria)]|uniref:TetR family transcriptional regulator n=1 Tax=Gordonia sp. (in: high G+C Gram-positive bacteria) TaxID=84139 RepID=UPI003C781855
MAELRLGVGESVRLLRVRRGFTLRRLAAGIGVSAGTMSAIENGKVAVTLDRLAAIAQALDVDTAELMDARIGLVATPDQRNESADLGWREFEPLDLDPVLEAAVEVFGEVGYHGAAMRMIAASAGLSVAGIYRHHPSKKHLLATIAEALEDDLAWRVEVAARPFSNDPAAAFAAMTEALSLFHLRRLEQVLVVETELRRLDEPSRERVTARRRELMRSFERTALAAVESGRFASESPISTVRAIVAMCRALPLRFGHGAALPGPAVAQEYAGLALLMVKAEVQQD